MVTARAARQHIARRHEGRGRVDRVFKKAVLGNAGRCKKWRTRQREIKITGVGHCTRAHAHNLAGLGTETLSTLILAYSSELSGSLFRSPPLSAGVMSNIPG
jgi:hypothetical protein